MKNPLHETQRTKRGTVVYKRKPHRWKISDMFRVATAMGVQRVLVGKKLFEQLRQIALSGVKSIEEYVADPFAIKARLEQAPEIRIYIIEEEL